MLFLSSWDRVVIQIHLRHRLNFFLMSAVDLFFSPLKTPSLIYYFVMVENGAELSNRKKEVRAGES